MTWRTTRISLDALGSGQLRGVDVDGTEVVVGRLGSEVFALADHCPHRDGQLSDGTLEGERLTCPLHGAVFDVRTGVVVADPFGIEPPEGGVEAVRRFPVKVEAGVVWVEFD